MARRYDFAFSLKLGVGQYMPTGSVFHHIDPRVKIVVGILLISAAIAGQSLLGLGVIFFLLVCGLFISRVQIRLAFTTVAKMMPYLLILALIQLFAVPQLHESSNILWQWRILIITDKSLLSGILLIMRFTVIVLGLSLFSYTTTTTQLMHGIEHLLRPLQKLRFPAHELALVLNIALRFIPILSEETEKLMKAQASRGADFGSGQRMGFIKRMRRMFPLFIPLFVQSLKHADRLVEAMGARCYTGGRGRTNLIHLHTEMRDYMALFIGIVVIGGAVTAGLLGIDVVLWRIFSTHMYRF